MNMEHEIKSKIADIKLLVLDVDGVLTDGTLVISSGDGDESKFFNGLDWHGIRLWRRAGLKIAFLSGRYSEPTQRLAEELEVDHCLQNCLDKLPALKDLLAKTSILPADVAYVGDDLPDIPPMRFVGFSIAVANAVDEVKKHADFITIQKGGSGAVREVIEYILKNTGRWQQLMKRYLT